MEPTPQANQANVEFFFRLLYNCFHGACSGGSSVGASELSAWLAHLWIWINVVGYALSVVGLFIIVYCTVRLFELRKREHEYYHTPLAGAQTGESPRWKRIQTLAAGTSQSEWREAIIEADIMLEDVLTSAGYEGDGVGEKLMSADPKQFQTLQDAWEAHKVRNLIAHEGSAFNISDTLTHRTIARYESVFREFKAI
jgi:hypothetical protein